MKKKRGRSTKKITIFDSSGCTGLQELPGWLCTTSSLTQIKYKAWSFSKLNHTKFLEDISEFTIECRNRDYHRWPRPSLAEKRIECPTGLPQRM